MGLLGWLPAWLPHQTVTPRTGASSLLALAHPAQTEAGRSAHFCRKKKRAHASRTSPGYHRPHLAGETKREAQGMKGRGPEGGHLWLALPSTLTLQMALQVFSPVSPSGREGLAPSAGHRLSFLPYLASVCLTRPDTAGQSHR